MHTAMLPTSIILQRAYNLSQASRSSNYELLKHFGGSIFTETIGPCYYSKACSYAIWSIVSKKYWAGDS